MSNASSENRPSFEQLMREGDVFMAQRAWSQARTAYETARDLAKDELSRLGDSADSERRKVLVEQLSALEGDYPNRIVMADDWRRRVVGLLNWVRGKLQVGQGRSAIFLNLRYQLAMNSIQELLRPTVSAVIDEVSETESMHKDDVANVVFAYLTHVFGVVDPDNENGLIDIAVEIPGDEVYNSRELALFRSDNALAAEERIVNRAKKILSGEKSRRMVENNQQAFQRLLEQVLIVMEAREGDADYQELADEIMTRILRGEAVFPPDSNN